MGQLHEHLLTSRSSRKSIFRTVIILYCTHLIVHVRVCMYGDSERHEYYAWAKTYAGTESMVENNERHVTHIGFAHWLHSWTRFIISVNTHFALFVITWKLYYTFNKMCNYSSWLDSYSWCKLIVLIVKFNALLYNRLSNWLYGKAGAAQWIIFLTLELMVAPGLMFKLCYNCSKCLDEQSTVSSWRNPFNMTSRINDFHV